MGTRNVGDPTNSPGAKWVDLEDDFDFYDALPQFLKRALAYSIVDFAAVESYEIAEQYGNEMALAIIRDSNKTNHEQNPYSPQSVKPFDEFHKPIHRRRHRDRRPQKGSLPYIGPVRTYRKPLR